MKALPLYLMLGAALGTMALISCSSGEPVVTSINVGIGTGTVSGNVFSPNAVTIPPGTTLGFTITSDEVHSVTTIGDGPPPAGPPPEWEASLTPGGPAAIDGANFVDTGLIGKGAAVSLEFPIAGS